MAHKSKLWNAANGSVAENSMDSNIDISLSSIAKDEEAALKR